ncbi:hypothetical protein [Moorena producens]|uniref:hypothetical protein n=1 Tax=Moorena producens TaxID=1155739 RepID=UPI001877493C|nr:hypothetical protein [Moorena producens]
MHTRPWREGVVTNKQDQVKDIYHEARCMPTNIESFNAMLGEVTVNFVVNRKLLGKWMLSIVKVQINFSIP